MSVPNPNPELARLNNALAALEGAVGRRLETEQNRADLEAGLAVMRDDRARLAVELDAALARVKMLEAASDAVDARLADLAQRLKALTQE